MNLSEKIMGLRTTAAALYDLAIRQGRKPADIQKDILPVTTKLHELIVDAVKHDLAGIVLAVQRFESQAEAHEDDIAFLKNKAQDAHNHANMLRKAVLDHMTDLGVDKLTHGNFMAIRTHHNGQDTVILR